MSVKTVPRYSEFVGCLAVLVLLNAWEHGSSEAQDGMQEGVGLLPCSRWFLKDLRFYFINMLFFYPFGFGNGCGVCSEL